MTNGTSRVVCLSAALLAACAAEPARPGELAPDAPPPVASAALCARADDDVSELFCGAASAPIASLAELIEVLDLDRSLLLGHSTALDGRLVTPINPRALFLRDERAEGLVAVTFTRGAQRVEMIARDRSAGRLNLYLLEFQQACTSDPGGCSHGDLFTPAIERDWTALRLRDDEDLKNTPLDCRRCHGGAPHDGGKPMLLMRELDPPWLHWFGTRLGALHEVFYAARHSEPYAGVTLPSDSPSLLENRIRIAENEGDQWLQPLTFLSGIIALETREVLNGPPAAPPDAHASPTWQLLFDAYREGLAPAPPYHHELITDPDKLAAATRAYRDYLAERIDQDDLPDLSDVLPDDPARLAEMGFAVEPDAAGPTLLIQGCGPCHNAALDPTLSRARFDIDLSRVAPETLELASARLDLRADDPGAMPPPGSRTMSEAQRRALRDYLRSVDPSSLPARPALETVASRYALEPRYDYVTAGAPSGELLISDVNGDGAPDVVASSLLFEQRGDGTFGDPRRLPLESHEPLEPMTLVDVDGDDRLDIVSLGALDAGATSYERGLTVFLSEGGLRFTAGTASPGPTPLDLVRASFADVNGDGRLDLVTRAAYPAGRVVLYLGDGRGAFEPTELELELPEGAQLGALTLGEVTGDDRADLVLIDSANPPSMIVHERAGSSFQASGARYEVPGGFTTRLEVSIGDGNGDGRNDVAISPGIRLMLQDERGGFGPAPLIETNDGPARFFDVDGDGRDDLIALAQDTGRVRILLQGPRGLMHPERLIFSLPRMPGSVLDALAVSDLDGDGCGDVAVARNGSIAVLHGVGCDR